MKTFDLKPQNAFAIRQAALATGPRQQRARLHLALVADLARVDVPLLLGAGRALAVGAGHGATINNLMCL